MWKTFEKTENLQTLSKNSEKQENNPHRTWNILEYLCFVGACNAVHLTFNLFLVAMLVYSVRIRKRQTTSEQTFFSTGKINWLSLYGLVIPCAYRLRIWRLGFFWKQAAVERNTPPLYVDVVPTSMLTCSGFLPEACALSMAVRALGRICTHGRIAGSYCSHCSSRQCACFKLGRRANFYFGENLRVTSKLRACLALT